MKTLTEQSHQDSEQGARATTSCTHQFIQNCVLSSGISERCVLGLDYTDFKAILKEMSPNDGESLPMSKEAQENKSEKKRTVIV
jgi:hypothetical protein